MPKELEDCVKKLVAEGKSEDAAYAICNASLGDSEEESFGDEAAHGVFNDSLIWDNSEKTGISVRDGVIEYLGHEIGMSPPEKLFTVYRSPATIANAAAAMMGIPLTDEHVSTDEPVSNPVGDVRSSEMVDYVDESTNTKLAVKNQIGVSDSILGALATGKRQLSLGYKAVLVPHNEYDFEQKRIRPHHLAVVPAGRCGPACSFIDRKPEEKVEDMKLKLNKVFLDAEGSPNLQQIVEIAQQLPEALKAVPVDKLQELMPMLQEIVAMAQPEAETPSTEAGSEVEAEVEAEVEDEDTPAEEMADEDDGKEIPITDTAAFKDAMNAAIKTHGEVITKARGFLDEDYDFSAKSTADIMKDAVASVHEGVEFTDSELSVAFKLLKKPESNYKSFGDAGNGGNAGKFEDLKDKEL